MDSLTIRIITFIFGGIIFILIGYFNIKSKWIKSGILCIGIGVFIIYSTIGPLSKSREQIESIQTIDSTEIIYISIIIPSTQEKNNIVKDKILITDRNTINKLSYALSKTKIEGEGFLKSPEWIALVEIELKSKKKIKFAVKRKNYETGLDVYSNGESGWHYGKLRATEFGHELQQIIK